jgi:hypothetical protein
MWAVVCLTQGQEKVYLFDTYEKALECFEDICDDSGMELLTVEDFFGLDEREAEAHHIEYCKRHAEYGGDTAFICEVSKWLN